MTVVTGGTGFIGAHLIEKLAASGVTVRALVRRKTALPAGVEPFPCDLADGAGIGEALRGAATVIHLAGVTKALRTQDYYTGNVRATENLARAIAGRGVRFVHVSSLAAAGPSLDGAPVTEDDPPHPVSHYGKSKLEAEQTVRALLPAAVIVRPPVVYGPRDAAVLQILKSVAKGLWLEIGGGDRWFSAIYVGDLVEGILQAARAPQAAGRTYFLSHPKPCTWGDLAAIAGHVMNRKPVRIGVPVPAAVAVGWCAEVWARLTGRPGIVSRDKIVEARCARWTCNTGRAAGELGFEARTPIENGLVQTLAWYKEAGWINF